MMKRVLMIAFHFPPQAASSGIQRTLNFSKHLDKHGWEPMVLSAHPRAYDAQNPSQLASVPPGLIVRRVFALDAKRHLGIRGRYMELLALPDRWVSWWLGAIPSALSLIRKYRPQVIWSTFPISTAHLIGLTLHRLTGLPWIADFRDPMLQPTYPTSSMQRRFYGWIERQTVTCCQAAVFTTHSAMQTYRMRFPDISPEKFLVIENGYDEESFMHAQPTTPTVSDTRPLTLVHSGVLYQTGRDPSHFLEAISMLKQQGSLNARMLHVVLRAPGDLPQMTELVRRYKVDDIIEVAAPVPYQKALQEMLSADGLLIFQGAQFNAQIPAKVYEYFRARKPIMALVDPAGETAKVLSAAGFDSMAAMDDSKQIAIALERFIDQVREGAAHVASEFVIAGASRAGRTKELAEVFNRAITCKSAAFASNIGANKP